MTATRPDTSSLLEEDEGPDHHVPAARSVVRRGRVNARAVKRPARYGTVGDRVIALEHRDLGGFLLGKPVPLVVGAVGEAGGLANAVVVDAVVGDIWLVGERGPRAKHEGILTHGLHRLGKVDRHKAARHFGVGLGFGVVLRAPEVAQVLREQLAAADAAAVIVQVVVNDVGVVGIHARIFVGLILGAVALVVLVKYVVVVHERIRRAGEKLQQKLLHFRVEYALNLGGIIEVLAPGLAVPQRNAKPVHARGAVGRETGVIFLHATRIA